MLREYFELICRRGHVSIILKLSLITCFEAHPLLLPCVNGSKPVCLQSEAPKSRLAWPQLQVCVQRAGAWRARCTRCTEVQGWVSRLGGRDVQRQVFGTHVEEDRESFILIFNLNWTYWYQELRTCSRVFFVPCKVIKQSITVVAVQNRNSSFLHTQGWRMLLNLLLVAILLLTIHPCLERQ